MFVGELGATRLPRFARCNLPNHSCARYFTMVPNAIDQSLQVPVISSRKSVKDRNAPLRSAQSPSGYTATRESHLALPLSTP